MLLKIKSGRSTCQMLYRITSVMIAIYVEISFWLIVYYIYPGLLTGCGKKIKIVRDFGGKLCGTKGRLCGDCAALHNVSVSKTGVLTEYINNKYHFVNWFERLFVYDCLTLLINCFLPFYIRVLMKFLNRN